MDYLHEVATSQAVWALCCIALTVWVIKSSEKREKSLMKHLERSNKSQERTANALQSIETRMDSMEKIIYKKEEE